MVKETAEQSGESPPTYPVSNISRDPSHCDWRIQLFGSRSSVTLPVKSHCKDTSADPTVPLNRLLEIRLSRSASIKSRDMVSRGTEKDFGVLLRGSVEMTVHLVLFVPLLVLWCLWRRYNIRGRISRYPTPEPNPSVRMIQTFIVDSDITRRQQTYTRNTCRKAIRQCWKVTE